VKKVKTFDEIHASLTLTKCHQCKIYRRT